MLFIVANGKDDSPLKDASIKTNGTNIKTTDENGNHIEEHCKALPTQTSIQIEKEKFCPATIVTDKKLEGTKAYKWAFLHPVSSQ